MVTATEGGPLPPLERFLQDPWGSLADLAIQLVGVAAGWGLRLLLVVVPLWLAGVVAARGWRRWRQQRLAAGARLVGILPPPQVEPGAADALWGNLAGLLRRPVGVARPPVVIMVPGLDSAKEELEAYELPRRWSAALPVPIRMQYRRGRAFLWRSYRTLRRYGPAGVVKRIPGRLRRKA